MQSLELEPIFIFFLRSKLMQLVTNPGRCWLNYAQMVCASESSWGMYENLHPCNIQFSSFFFLTAVFSSAFANHFRNSPK